MELSTGDGLKLTVPLAGLGERGLALAIDVLILAVAAVPLSITDGFSDPWIPIALAAFIVRHAYFTAVGSRLGGSTIGKYALGIRVIAVGDGALTWRRLLVRSLVRDLELSLPLLAVSGLWIGVTDELWIGAAAWVAVFGLIPVVHPRHRRLADMIAGTAVAQRPSRVTMPLGVVEPRSIVANPPRGGAAAVLGVRHMEVLARLLREVEPTTDAGQTVRYEVARSLAGRLGRCVDTAGNDPDRFLRGVYAELASHHARERRMGRQVIAEQSVARPTTRMGFDLAVGRAPVAPRSLLPAGAYFVPTSP